MHIQRFFPSITTLITLTLLGGQGKSLERQRTPLIVHSNTNLELTIDVQDKTPHLIFKDVRGLQYYVIRTFSHNQDKIRFLEYDSTAPTNLTLFKCSNDIYTIGDDVFHLARFSVDVRKYLFHKTFKLTKTTIQDGSTHYRDIFNARYTIKDSNPPEALTLTICDDSQYSDRYNGTYRDERNKTYRLHCDTSNKPYCRHLEEIEPD